MASFGFKPKEPNDEVSSLSTSEIQIEKGGVSFKGTIVDIYKINLCSRLGMNLLVKIVSFNFKTIKDFYTSIYQYKWNTFIDPKSRIKELRIRQNMLQLHQKIALFTLGCMTYQYNLGLEMDHGYDNKMKDKHLDYIVLNYANEENAGFEANTNHVIIFGKNDVKKELSLDRKDRIARQLINFIINNK